MGEFIRQRRLRLGYGQEAFAEMVGVSWSYIQKIERNVKRQVGASVITGLTVQLRLNHDEAAYLRVLNGGRDVGRGPGAGAKLMMTRLLEAFEPHAAAHYRGWRVLAANGTFHALWPGLAQSRSLLEWLFDDRRAGAVFADLNEEQRRAVAYFRGYAASPINHTFVTELLAEMWEYPRFRQLWERGDVLMMTQARPRTLFYLGAEVTVQEVLLPWIGQKPGEALYLGMICPS